MCPFSVLLGSELSIGFETEGGGCLSVSEVLTKITSFHEALHRAVPNNESAIAASKLYATSPHLAGSEQVGTENITKSLFASLGTFPFLDCVSRMVSY